MNNYETVFILTPFCLKQTKEASKSSKSLKNNGAKLNHEESWGLKNLPILFKKSTGFYFLLEFQAEGNAINRQVELKEMKG